ncbi:UDP-N-acetylmuramoyl-tripeptide--D-alanyl-D-alanine ligase [Gracilibacillus oryzae]|uniref:UDP-N-acetylmuramoyl-tripeptide--D-alanyl-D-alanine ligase n=1 Tax=Gracilibacillus oryzae TaxID=1672701 RepID=A0A7C8GRS4_9BACI|nr:UDP-N-acetylmuramoyl-tripeptide--D-alanyl-D-alanine ligase [Gracilibacillus oryzae]KAB8129863.1 UDP-N-acetylmuramoyl-tripeptide--D-alanyl-D-alanine ligase [Gracilibacillus oryzae]
MITRSLNQIAIMSNAILSHPEAGNKQISGVSIDTRSIDDNQLFIPLQGTNFDGHRFVEKAFEAGAGTAFWKKDVPDPPENLPLLFVEDPLQAMQDLARNYREELGVTIIGITGSNGKTTTKDMIAQVLSDTYKVQKTSGNFNSQQGLPLTLLSLEESTEIMVLEMGMSALGQIEKLSYIAKPDIAVITNIGEAHMEELGSRENIATAKFEIIKGLKPNGLFIFDGDEPLLLNKVQNLSYPFTKKSIGMDKKSALYPESVLVNENGTFFKVNILPDTTIQLPVLGMHNVKNALFAIAIANYLNVPDRTIQQQLESLRITAMRMETHQGVNGALIINDAYNASPTSMRAAIDLVAQLNNFSKKILVLGDMLELGSREVAFHQEVGHFIAEHDVQYVFTYGELGKQIAIGVMEQNSSIDVRSFADKKEITEVIQSLLDEQTVLLLKASRGMKLEEVLEGLVQD